MLQKYKTKGYKKNKRQKLKCLWKHNDLMNQIWK